MLLWALTQLDYAAGEAAETAGIIIAAIDGIIYDAGIEPKLLDRHAPASRPNALMGQLLNRR
jgi:hypothetical protein